MISSEIIDEDVNLPIIQSYLSDEAWLAVEQLYEIKKANNKWNCQECQEDVDLFKSIRCDSCLEWFHQKCVFPKKATKTINWFCSSCKIDKN